MKDVLFRLDDFDDSTSEPFYSIVRDPEIPAVDGPLRDPTTGQPLFRYVIGEGLVLAEVQKMAAESKPVLRSPVCKPRRPVLHSLIVPEPQSVTPEVFPSMTQAKSFTKPLPPLPLRSRKPLEPPAFSPRVSSLQNRTQPRNFPLKPTTHAGLSSQPASQSPKGKGKIRDHKPPPVAGAMLNHLRRAQSARVGDGSSTHLTSPSSYDIAHPSVARRVKVGSNNETFRSYSSFFLPPPISPFCSPVSSPTCVPSSPLSLSPSSPHCSPTSPTSTTSSQRTLTQSLYLARCRRARARATKPSTHPSLRIFTILLLLQNSILALILVSCLAYFIFEQLRASASNQALNVHGQGQARGEGKVEVGEIWAGMQGGEWRGEVMRE